MKQVILSLLVGFAFVLAEQNDKYFNLLPFSIQDEITRFMLTKQYNCSFYVSPILYDVFYGFTKDKKDNENWFDRYKINFYF